MKFEQIVDPAPLAYRERFSEREFEQIRGGFSPRDMDDRWTIFYEHPYLNINRSWTGQCIYRVEFFEDGQGVTVVDAICAKAMLSASDPQQQSDILEFLVGNLLLGRGLSFPNPKNVAPEHPSLYQHVVSGTACPEKVSNSKRQWWKIWR